MTVQSGMCAGLHITLAGRVADTNVEGAALTSTVTFETDMEVSISFIY